MQNVVIDFILVHFIFTVFTWEPGAAEADATGVPREWVTDAEGM